MLIAFLGRSSQFVAEQSVMSRGYINRIYSIHKFVRSGDIIKFKISRNMHEAGLNFGVYPIEKFCTLNSTLDIFMTMHNYCWRKNKTALE